MIDKNIASEELISSFKPEELKGLCEKIDGTWYCAAFVDRGDNRTICAISQGKKMKTTLKEAMANAIERLTGDVE